MSRARRRQAASTDESQMTISYFERCVVVCRLVIVRGLSHGLEVGRLAIEWTPRFVCEFLRVRRFVSRAHVYVTGPQCLPLSELWSKIARIMTKQTLYWIASKRGTCRVIRFPRDPYHLQIDRVVVLEFNVLGGRLTYLLLKLIRRCERRLRRQVPRWEATNASRSHSYTFFK